MKHKRSQSLSSGILFIAVVMAIFTFAMFESENITGMSVSGDVNSNRFNLYFSSSDPISKAGETYGTDNKVNGYLLQQGNEKYWLTNSIPDIGFAVLHWNKEKGKWGTGTLNYDRVGPFNSQIDSYKTLEDYDANSGYTKEPIQTKDTYDSSKYDPNTKGTVLPNWIKDESPTPPPTPTPAPAAAPPAAAPAVVSWTAGTDPSTDGNLNGWEYNYNPTTKTQEVEYEGQKMSDINIPEGAIARQRQSDGSYKYTQYKSGNWVDSSSTLPTPTATVSTKRITVANIKSVEGQQANCVEAVKCAAQNAGISIKGTKGSTMFPEVGTQVAASSPSSLDLSKLDKSQVYYAGFGQPYTESTTNPDGIDVRHTGLIYWDGSTNQWMWSSGSENSKGEKTQVKSVPLTEYANGWVKGYDSAFPKIAIDPNKAKFYVYDQSKAGKPTTTPVPPTEEKKTIEEIAKEFGATIVKPKEGAAAIGPGAKEEKPPESYVVIPLLDGSTMVVDENKFDELWANFEKNGIDSLKVIKNEKFAILTKQQADAYQRGGIISEKNGQTVVTETISSSAKKTQTTTETIYYTDHATSEKVKTTYNKKFDKYAPEELTGKGGTPIDTEVTEIQTTQTTLDANNRVTSTSVETKRMKDGKEVDYTKTEERSHYDEKGKKVIDSKAATKMEDGVKVKTVYSLKDGSPEDVLFWDETKKQFIHDENLLKAKQQNYKAGTKLKNVMAALQTPGVGRFVGLFMDDDAFAEWREGVDKIFCETVLLGGADCWTSKLCSSYSDMEGKSYLNIQSPYGMLELAAHIEGQRTSMIYGNETGIQMEYIYKISAMARNPANSNKEMKFNIVLSGDRTIELYENDITLEEGNSFQRTGSAIIVQYSQHLYNKICIKFQDSIDAGGGRYFDEVCNKITEYTGGPMSYEEAVTQTTQSGGDGSDNGLNQAERLI